MTSVIQTSNIAKDAWITPEEQLDRLLNYYAKEVLECHPEIGSDVADLIEDFCMEPPNPKLTNWYTALVRLEALPPSIPPLPENIIDILESPCPIWKDDLKVGDTHSLYLIPAGSLNELEKKVQAYDLRFFGPHDYSFRFDYWWSTARKEHEWPQFNDPFWTLMTNTVLPKSRWEHYKTQAQMVKNLGNNYVIPTLKSAVMSAVLRKIATREDRYPISWFPHTYTRIRETIRSDHLVVGQFFENWGLNIRNNVHYAREDIGIVAMRQFP